MDKKIEEAREFLQTIGMPKAQQADICCYVILAMAGIKPDMSWSEGTNEWIRILKSVYLIATRDLSNLWLQFFLSQNQGFMRLFEKTVLK